jgi:hypothetical protein
MNTYYFAFDTFYFADEYVLLPKACFNRCQLYGLNATNVGGWRAKSLSSTPRRVGCSKFRYKSDIKNARIQLVKLLIFNILYCEIVL